MTDLTFPEALSSYCQVYIPSRNFVKRTRIEYVNDLEGLIGLFEQRGLTQDRARLPSPPSNNTWLNWIGGDTLERPGNASILPCVRCFAFCASMITFARISASASPHPTTRIKNSVS